MSDAPTDGLAWPPRMHSLAAYRMLSVWISFSECTARSVLTCARMCMCSAQIRPGGPNPADDPRLDALSERERQVLCLVAHGLSNAEIADALFVSHGTVKTHVGRVLSELGLRDRVQAVVLAYETGLVRPGGGAA